MIDINKPVKQGSDLVLNYDEGEAKLGSASGFAREAKAGKLRALPPNDNWDDQPQRIVSNGNPQPDLSQEEMDAKIAEKAKAKRGRPTKKEV